MCSVGNHELRMTNEFYRKRVESGFVGNDKVIEVFDCWNVFVISEKRRILFVDDHIHCLVKISETGKLIHLSEADSELINCTSNLLFYKKDERCYCTTIDGYELGDIPYDLTHAIQISDDSMVIERERILTIKVIKDADDNDTNKQRLLINESRCKFKKDLNYNKTVRYYPISYKLFAVTNELNSNLTLLIICDCQNFQEIKRFKLNTRGIYKFDKENSIFISYGKNPYFHFDQDELTIKVTDYNFNNNRITLPLSHDKAQEIKQIISLTTPLLKDLVDIVLKYLNLYSSLFI